MEQTSNIIVVCDNDGKRYKMVMKGEMDLLTVGKIKRYLHTATGVESQRQLLRFGGQVLSDGMSGGEIGLFDGAVIHLDVDGFQQHHANMPSAASSFYGAPPPPPTTTSTAPPARLSPQRTSPVRHHAPPPPQQQHQQPQQQQQQHQQSRTLVDSNWELRERERIREEEARRVTLLFEERERELRRRRDEAEAEAQTLRAKSRERDDDDAQRRLLLLEQQQQQQQQQHQQQLLLLQQQQQQQQQHHYDVLLKSAATAPVHGGVNNVSNVSNVSASAPTLSDADRVRLLLRAFCQHLQIGPLELDKNNTCVVALDADPQHGGYKNTNNSDPALNSSSNDSSDDALNILLTFDAATGRLFMYSTLLNNIPQDASTKLRVFEALLEGALLGRDMCGGGVGVSAKNGLILMSCSIDVRHSTEGALAAVADSFFDSLKRWQQTVDRIVAEEDAAAAAAAAGRESVHFRRVPATPRREFTQQ